MNVSSVAPGSSTSVSIDAGPEPDVARGAIDAMADSQPSVKRTQQELTILVPALNEEVLIRRTVEEILPAARRLLHVFEIILVDDGSTDSTGAIMDELAVTHAEISVIHHEENYGLAYTFREAIAAASYRHLTLVPGDLSFHAEGLCRLFEATGTSDLVLGYRDNLTEVVPVPRLLSSKLLWLSMLPLIGTPVKDVHGPAVYPVWIMRQLDLRAEGFSFSIEALVQLFNHGVSLTQVPVQLNGETVDNSSALRPTTLLHMAKTWFRLLVLRLRRRKSY